MQIFNSFNNLFTSKYIVYKSRIYFSHFTLSSSLQRWNLMEKSKGKNFEPLKRLAFAPIFLQLLSAKIRVNMGEKDGIKKKLSLRASTYRSTERMWTPCCVSERRDKQSYSVQWSICRAGAPCSRLCLYLDRISGKAAR